MVRIKSEEKAADHGQNLDNLARVISQALGGKKDEADEDVKVIESWGELVSAFTGVGGALG